MIRTIIMVVLTLLLAPALLRGQDEPARKAPPERTYSRTPFVHRIVLLDEDGVHLRQGAAPSLPDSYNQAIDGAVIGPRAEIGAGTVIGVKPSRAGCG